MITPARILNKYRAVEVYLDPVRKKVRDTLLKLCEDEGFALVSRIKALDSVCEKVETGRFASWSQIDDLVAFTIVVPKLSDEAPVLQFLEGAFDKVEVRARGSAMKAPDVFRFDTTRFIGRLSRADKDSPPPLFGVPFEVQIRSAFEHAWSVTTHALSYKSTDVSWSKLRLTAQLKAAVEQLDTLVAAFDDAANYIEPSVWPEVQVKADLKSFFASQVASGVIPAELAPKDWSRFVDNVYGAVMAGRDRTRPDEVGQLVRTTFEMELADLGSVEIPMSISLWQFTFASLVKRGVIGTTPRKHWPLITPELEALYPSVGAITQRFDYS